MRDYDKSTFIDGRVGFWKVVVDLKFASVDLDFCFIVK